MILEHNEYAAVGRYTGVEQERSGWSGVCEAVG